MSLSRPIVTVLQECESAFSRPARRKMQILIGGTLLARARRTMAAALYQMGLSEAPQLYPLPSRAQSCSIVGIGIESAPAGAVRTDIWGGRWRPHVRYQRDLGSALGPPHLHAGA